MPDAACCATTGAQIRRIHADFGCEAHPGIMLRMSNQAYLSIWCKDFPEGLVLERFEKFLSSVPFSAKKPGFNYLEIRAVDWTESPVYEQDLRSVPLDAASIIELCKPYVHNDCSISVRSQWDLWVYQGDPARWQFEPQALELLCYGEDFDEGVWREDGHLEVNFGFEHLFTGHAGLLGIRQIARPKAESPEEERFLEAMARPENLRNYDEKTRENIKKLFDWVRRVEKALPVEKLRLWSEGEENFEARLEEILAVR
jgi:hypothetical protein